MNKYITTLRATALAALLVPALAACTDQADGTDPATTGLFPLHLTTTIDGGIAATSRATSASPSVNEIKSQFNADDRISLTYTNDHIKALSNAPGDEVQTVDAIYGANGQWTFGAGTTVYLDYPSPQPVTAFYPAAQQLADGGLDAAGVRLIAPTETSLPPALECVDALRGSAKPTLVSGGIQAEAAVTLSHLHQLLNIGIDARTIDGNPTVDAVQVVLKVSYTPTDGGAATDYWVAATPGSASEVAEGDRRNFYHAIVPATAAPEVIDITRSNDATPLPPTGEGMYTLCGAAITVRGGRVYHLTVNGGREMKPNYRLTLNVTLRGDVVDFDFTNNGLGWNQGTAPEAIGYDLVISTAEELYNFTYAVAYDHYITYLDGSRQDARRARVLQTADIDLSPYEWIPIGSNPNYPFVGKYNGNGFKIKNLKITNATGSASGLFGYVAKRASSTNTEEPVLTGIQLEGVTINANQGAVGALAGSVKESYVSLCKSTEVTITGNVAATASTNSTIGGLVGTAEKSSITRCSASLKSVVVTTAKEAYIGGLIGSCITSNNLIASCSTAGELTITANAPVHAGGLAGHIVQTEVCANLSTVTLTLSGSGTAHAGGLVGDASNKSSISGCYTTGNVSSGTKTGALVGVVGSDCTFTYCYGKYSAGTSEIVSGATSSNITYKNGGEPDLDNSATPPTAYTDEVYQIVQGGTGGSGYSTAHNAGLYPAYDMTPMPVSWDCTEAWNSGTGYPGINMSYAGDDIS